MARYRVARAQSWEQVNEAACVGARCIRDGAGNNVKAKQSWDVYSSTEDCLYYMIWIVAGNALAGYLRLLCVTGSSDRPRTYVADFYSPSLYEPIILAAQSLEAAVLVKDFTADDSLLVEKWPRFCARWPKLDRYPYHNTPISESAWMAVVK